MLTYAIIPARSGSTGLKDKNVMPLNGRPLIDYSIKFAQKLGVDKVICSTDSEGYADIARACGAEVPFLRSAFAATNTAMEQDILKDMYARFADTGIAQPDILVWLRPTFVFRSLDDVQRCITMLKEDPSLTAARTVCESECRLYSVDDDRLVPQFDDQGKSMIRRQDIGSRYKVFSTDVFRATGKDASDDFLGRKVAAVVTNKICGLDIDDATDFRIVEAVARIESDDVQRYIH
jgi:CMP-N-acetylneuraminic acid synthetase